jgi:hypothetical protein
VEFKTLWMARAIHLSHLMFDMPTLRPHLPLAARHFMMFATLNIEMEVLGRGLVEFNTLR